MSDIVDLGTAKLDPRTNALLVQAKTTQSGSDPDDAPGNDDMPICCALGVTALPAPSNDNGCAQGIKADVPGSVSGWVVAGRDTRSAKVVAEMGAGETCLHSTGDGFDSRFFAKNQLAAIVVGDDVALVLDRIEKKATLSAFGGHIEVSESDGIYFAHGGAMIQIKDGMISLCGKVVVGGRVPAQPMLMGQGGPATAPIPGVFAGA